MKKLNLAIALALGLIVPFGVTASEGDEVNKYAMEMNQKSTEDVMKRVEMPDAAAEKATEEGVFKHRYTEEAHGVTQGKGKAYAGEDIPGDKDASGVPAQGTGKMLKKKLGKGTGDHTGQGTGEGVGDLDRDRIRDQDEEHIRDQDQDRDRDQDQDRSMEMDQDQLRDTDHEFDKDPPTINDQEPETPQEMDQNQNEHETGVEDSGSGSSGDGSSDGGQQGSGG